MTAALPVVVLISGRGSNLKAILDAVAHDNLPVSIRAVIANRPQAPGLQFARAAGVPTLALDHQKFPTRDSFDAALMQAIDRHAPGLVVLAGFMRILGRDFIARYRGRLINIHPSLLPQFPGLDTHARAIAAGVKEHGATVHFVTDEVDGGPIIAQARVPVRPDDSAATLAARVLEAEHRLLPQAMREFAAGRVALDATADVIRWAGASAC